jgi:hypothetical protein
LRAVRTASFPSSSVPFLKPFFLPPHLTRDPEYDPQRERSLNSGQKFRRPAPPNHTCEDEVALIADYLAGELKPEVVAAFEKHFVQCPDCNAFLNTYKKTIEVTNSFLRVTSLKTWPLGLLFEGQDYSLS